MKLFTSLCITVLVSLFTLAPVGSSLAGSTSPSLTLQTTELERTGEASLPRGIRNNNPGNIVANEIQWRGQRSRCSDPRFVCFTSPRYGIRAMALILYSYHHSHSIDTIEEVIERWAPPEENPTEALTAFVRASLEGVSRVGPDNLYLLLEALIEAENGIQPYNRQLIKQVVKDAYSGRDYNDAWFIVAERIPQTDGDEARPEEARTRASNGSCYSPEESSAGSSSAQRQGVSVDSKNHSNLGLSSYYSFAQGSPPVRVDGHARYIWVDRMGEWVPILHGGKRDVEMERGGRSSDHTPRHPRNLRDPWTLFWRKLSGT